MTDSDPPEPPKEQRRYDVHVSGGQGAVIGDYAKVFQYFGEAPRALATLIRTAEFAALTDERTRHFVGREFVFEGIEGLLASGEHDSGYIVIRGEPGIGKTAIAATLVKRRGCVHHFNIAPQGIRSARDFLHNTCAQLIVRYGLDHPSLPPEAGEDSGFLSRLLAEAAERARDRDELPVLVVVDALDEAEDSGLDPAANRLYLPPVLPAGVSSWSQRARRRTTA
jgi:hypothetical protein